MNSNSRMVDSLVEKGYIETDRVEKAFRQTDRIDFTPEYYRDWTYKDRPIPLSKGATLSAPSMVAINTELLDVGRDDKVVEIGSGSGYQAAILSELCQKVFGVEIIPQLVSKSRKVLKDRNNVEIFQGSGFQPLENQGLEKFDRILYSCAIDSLEEAEKHLKTGGVAVAPVKSENDQILTKIDSEGRSFHGSVKFVSFVNE